MSLDLQKMVWEDPEPRGAALTVLLLLASYVPHERWTRGDAAWAWPSQNTIATKCNCERSTVQRALEELQKLGKIKDTGLRKTRRSIVWELYPPADVSDVKSGVEFAEEYEAGVGADLTDGGSGDDMADSRSSREIHRDDLTDPEIHLTDPASDLTDGESSTWPNIGHKREEPETHQKEIDAVEMRARAGARNSSEGGDLSGELAEVEALLERRPSDRLLSARRDELLVAVGGER